METETPGPRRGPASERLTWTQGAEPAVPAPALPAPAPAAPPEGAAPASDGHLGRAFVEAFDRLSDRLLERLRSLRHDVDADLDAVRGELAGLRQAVDAVADRVQSRQVRSTLDEVHGEVIALRTAVLEWPELEQISLDLTAIRGDLAFLFESGGGAPAQAPSELLGELQHLVANLAGEVRRLSAPPVPVRMDEEQLGWLVEAVAARVVELQRGPVGDPGTHPDDGDDGGRRRGRRR